MNINQVHVVKADGACCVQCVGGRYGGICVFGHRGGLRCAGDRHGIVGACNGDGLALCHQSALRVLDLVDNDDSLLATGCQTVECCVARVDAQLIAAQSHTSRCYRAGGTAIDFVT